MGTGKSVPLPLRVFSSPYSPYTNRGVFGGEIFELLLVPGGQVNFIASVWKEGDCSNLKNRQKERICHTIQANVMSGLSVRERNEIISTVCDDTELRRRSHILRVTV